MTYTPLDSILNDTEEAAEIVEVEAVTEEPEAPEEAAQPSEGQERGPDGKFLPKQTGVEDAGPPPDKLPKEDYKAIREEREKRQRLEAELETLKQQFQQQPKVPPAPPPSVWDDEQQAFQHRDNQVLERANALSRLNASEFAARARHPDFAEKQAVWEQLAAQNPAIVVQAFHDPDPWGKAMQIVTAHERMQELGAVNVSELEAKLRAQIEAEMKQSAVSQPIGVPPTITGQRNVGSRTGPAWAGPQSLEDMLR